MKQPANKEYIEILQQAIDSLENLEIPKSHRFFQYLDARVDMTVHQLAREIRRIEGRNKALPEWLQY